ncbi:Hsp20/alpha crystallin family protein [Tamlana fucoidanivorans]|uniref:Hsp20/alpha crystallin family protein n=1 Tax=Allotamlana fucoidanivorans TaxID=2583814 RepID=A0A5C4SE80_9FLAO|nr:Hsp20/alpha crystallin family protein [Tamlana fucoidanivorans]TNJ41902.1 Hsp20/alpha crystallin family protein [Tamlana fucoidanivorans]
MSTLMHVPKNGHGAQKKSSFPTWTNWIDDLFDTEHVPTVFSSNYNSGMSMPKVNIKETKDDYFVEMAVPGMKKSDFVIDLDNDILSVSAEHKEESETKEENYTRKEFGYSSFKRTFSLPESINESKINATYNDGILMIQLPKREEAKQKPIRSIKIS